MTCLPSDSAINENRSWKSHCTNLNLCSLNSIVLLARNGYLTHYSSPPLTLCRQNYCSEIWKSDGIVRCCFTCCQSSVLITQAQRLMTRSHNTEWCICLDYTSALKADNTEEHDLEHPLQEWGGILVSDNESPPVARGTHYNTRRFPNLWKSSSIGTRSLFYPKDQECHMCAKHTSTAGSCTRMRIWSYLSTLCCVMLQMWCVLSVKGLISIEKNGTLCKLSLNQTAPSKSKELGLTAMTCRKFSQL